MSLHAADDAESPFKVCGASAQDIGHDDGAFNLSYYPKEDPFIVFGQKETNHSSKTALKTALSLRKFVSGLLILHSKSGNHANLNHVNNNFLDSLTDVQFLKGRVGSEDELGQLLYQHLDNFTKKHDIKLYEERACDSDDPDRVEAFNSAKTLKQKDDFVRCKLYWFSIQGGEEIRHKVYRFGLPHKDRSKKYQVSGCQELDSKYALFAPIYGLIDECKAKVCSKQNQKIVRKNVDKLKPVLAAHKYALEIQNSIKPSYAQTSFFVAGHGGVYSVCEQNCKTLHDLEGFLERKKRGDALLQALEKKSFAAFREEIMPSSHISWYKGVDEKDGERDADAILIMLHEGTKDWSGMSTDDPK